MAQSTSSALPPALTAALATASSLATCRAGPATLSGSATRSRGFSRASASRSPPPRARSPAASASSPRDRRRRRRPRASVPPSGPQSSSAAVWSSSTAGRSAQRSSMSSGRVPGSSASGSSSPATVTGIPAAVSARRSSGTCRAADRTRTAIEDQGTPSARWARRSVSATRAASWVELSAMRMRTSPGAGFPAIRSRWPMGPRGSRRATRREAASRTGPLRRQVCSGDDGRGLAGRGAESLRELGERAHVGAAELVDGLIRVADRDQLAAVAGQREQQRLLGRVAVLVLVDEHHVVRGALALPDVLAGEQGGGDADDLRVVVGRDRGQVEAGRVPVQERRGGHPVVAAALLAELAQPPAVQAALGRAQQQVADLLGEPPGGQGRPQCLGPAGPAVLGLAAQHAAHLEQLLGRRQQPGRLVTGEHELPAGQRVGVAVEGHGQRLAGGPPQPGGDPLAELGRRLAAEGEHEHALGVQAAPLDPVRDRGHDGGRLARPGAGQHQQRAACVVHHGLLRLVQARRRGRGTGRRTRRYAGA